eukprot:1686739-Prorocentrum_lima.AAC.1
MAAPTEFHWQSLKRLGRYLLSFPSKALEFHQQRMPRAIKISVDSDHATDKATRKSTTGMVIRLGQH